MMLADRQYGTGSNMTIELRWALEYIIDIAEMAQPRHHNLHCPSAPPALVHTDAAEEPGVDGQLAIPCGFVVKGRHDTI